MKYGHSLERAQALLGLGRTLLALERPGDAAPELEEASRAFRELGARPLLAQAEALLVDQSASAYGPDLRN